MDLYQILNRLVDEISKPQPAVYAVRFNPSAKRRKWRTIGTDFDGLQLSENQIRFLLAEDSLSPREIRRILSATKLCGRVRESLEQQKCYGPEPKQISLRFQRFKRIVEQFLLEHQP